MRSVKTLQGKSGFLFTEEAERKPMESVVFFRSGCINLTTLVIAVPILLLSAPVALPISKSSFHPLGISATLALSAPVGLSIAKSSLKEMSSGPTESGVYFWGLRLLPHENRWSGYIQHFFIYLFFKKAILQSTACTLENGFSFIQLTAC